MRFFILLCLSLIFLSCNKSDGNAEVDGQNVLNAPDNLATTDGVPAVALQFASNMLFTNFNGSEEEKMNSAIEIIKLVVATQEFKDKILNYTYGGEKAFVDNRGLTNAQIYQKILEGAEKLQPSIDNEMDGEIELYYENSRTIGYTYQNSNRIWVNTKYFNSYTPAGVAHNLFHEWMHKLGFTHATSWSESRDHSVPYAVGYIMGEIGMNFL